jgi:hypothetical protein
MAWETRGSGTYYYRKTRRGNKVVSAYVGGGDVGVCIALMDAEDRERRAEADRERRRAEAEADERFRRVEAACDLLASLATDLMESSGYHKHKGQWRRKRMALYDADCLKRGRAVRRPDLVGLLEKAHEGDMEAVFSVRAALKDDPEAYVLVGTGDMGSLALENLACQASQSGGKTDYLMWTAILTKLDLLRAELSGPNPTAVERLLVERVVLSHLQVHQLDVAAVGSSGDAIDRRRTRAHNRYLAALRSLAAARRVAPARVSNTQVNLFDLPERLVPDRNPIAAKNPPPALEDEQTARRLLDRAERGL